MFDLGSSGSGSDWAVKAARDMVATNLNETAFSNSYPVVTLDALKAMWYAAVACGDEDLQVFHDELSAWNSPEPPGYCPLP
jgi:hypothetical protein